MRRALLLLAVLASCKTSEKKAGTPAGPAAAASCDYVSKTVGVNHSCVEAYAETQVPTLEAWCAKLQGPRDKGTFAKTGCAAEGRDGGCLFPNGSVHWKYTGHLACIGTLEFQGTPPRKESTPYRCASKSLCTETQSVFDLTKTVTATNCESGGSTFGAGSCSTENVIARCSVRRADKDTTWFFYAPLPMEAVEKTCADLEGELTASTSGSASGSSAEGRAGSGSGSTEQTAGSAAK